MAASELQKAVDKLIKREPGWKQATTPPKVGPRPGTVSTGRPASAPGAGGATLTFVEQDYALRETYDERVLASSDGVFEIAWRPTKKIIGEAGGVIELKEPPAP